jgi:hypothetical protein
MLLWELLSQLLRWMFGADEPDFDAQHEEEMLDDEEDEEDDEEAPSW